MSIKLIMPTEIAGVSTPVTGNVLTLGAELEAKLVGTRRAVWVDNGVTNLEPLQVSKNLTGRSKISVASNDLNSQTKGYLSSVLIFGDSITGQNTQDIANSISWFDIGYLPWAQAFSGVDFDFVRNSGIAGDSTQVMLARTAADVLAHDSDVVIEMAGINGITTRTPEQMMADKILYWEQITGQGRYVIALACPPNGVGTDPTITRLARLNALIADYWRGRADGEFVDWYPSLTDTTNAVAPWKTSYATDSPATHPTNLGAFWMGKALAPVLSRLFKRRNLVSSPRDTRQYDATSNNIVDNPLMLGTAGTNGAGCSGSLASSWLALCSGGVTAVHSKGLANSGIGEKQIATLTATASGYWMLYNGSIHTRAAIADLLDGSARIKVIGATNLNSLYLTISSSAGSIVWGRKSGGTQVVLPSDFELLTATTRKGPLFAGTTSLQLNIRAEFSAAGSAVLELEQLEIRNYGQ